MTRTVEEGSPEYAQLKGSSHRPFMGIVTDAAGSAGATGEDHDNEEIIPIVDVAGFDLGVGQVVDPEGTGHYRQDILQLLDETRDYIADVVMVDKLYEPVRTLCKNKMSHCAFFAVSFLFRSFVYKKKCGLLME